MATAPKWLQAKIEVPSELTRSERRRLATKIIDFIIERTESGRGAKWNGSDYENVKFAKYSKSYAESLDFENAGKSRGDPNLTLTGDMLADMDYLDDKDTKNTITIGYDVNYQDRGKVEGNATGIRGSSSEVLNPRPFVGITQKDVDRLIKDFMD